MTKKSTDELIKLLRKLKNEHEPNIGRSTITDCCDFLIAALGGKV